MSAWLAPGEIIIAIGIAGHDAQQNEHDDRDADQRDERHPGDAGGSASSDHRSVMRLDPAAWPRARRRAAARLAVDARFQAAGDTSVGCKRAGHVRRDLEVRLVDDRLDVLQQRNDIALFGDVARRPPSSRRCASSRPSRPTAGRSWRRGRRSSRPNAARGRTSQSRSRSSDRRSRCPSCRRRRARACACVRSSKCLAIS